MSEITIVSGIKGSGKTTLILRLIEELKNEGLDVKGLASPGIYREGRKTGIFVENISTGERKQLAFYDPGWDPDMPNRVWRFDKTALDWGNEVLRKVNQMCDVLIVDEIGFLELEKGQGWNAIYDVINCKNVPRIFLVIRESLLSISETHWPGADVVHISQINDKDLWVSDEITRTLRLSGKHKAQFQKRR